MKEEYLISAKTKKELAADYGISVRSLRLWVAKLPEDIANEAKICKGKGVLTPAQVKTLVSFWGEP